MKKYPLPGHSVEQVFNSYCTYLAYTFGNPSQQLKAFVDRFGTDQEPPRGEAVVFTWLSNIGMNPSVNEDPGRGGMDFLCRPPSGKDFYVEVTSIGNQAMAEQTGLPLELENGVGGAYGLGTEMLRQRVGAKMEQLSRGNLPRVLVITSEHPIVNAVFDPNGATCLFLSKPAILVPFEGEERSVTDLRNSVFMKPDRDDPQRIVSARRSASAVILVPIHAGDIRPIGLLHPDPVMPLSLEDWYQTPFIRLRQWPVADGQLGIEWTIPYGGPFPVHRRLRLARRAQGPV